MSENYIDWSKLSKVKLELDKQSEQKKLGFMKVAVFNEAINAFVIKDMKAQLIRNEKEQHTNIATSVDMILSDVVSLSDDVLIKAFEDSISAMTELINIDSIKDALHEARRHLVQELWKYNKPAFIVEDICKFGTGEGLISSNNRTYGTFKGMEIHFTQNDTIDIALTYSYTQQVPSTIDVSYVMKDENIEIILNQVNINSTTTDGDFKTYHILAERHKLLVKKLNNSAGLKCPDMNREVTDIPRVNNLAISRRINNILSTDEVKIEKRRDKSVGTRFKNIL